MKKMCVQKERFGTGIVAQSTLEAEIRKIVVQGQLRRKICETLSQLTAGCGGIHLSSQLCREVQIRGLWCPNQGIK
jgi:translation initiation factor 1 (eIF-1/SUI1)